MAVKATSPDGRNWEIEAIREPFSSGGGFSLGNVVVTVLLLALVIGLAFVSWYFAVGAAIILLLWLGERISNHLRPRLRAQTKDPPAEEVTWKATRFARRELEQRIARV
ncbi:MAG TPA: hypothetical protein VKB73_12780, partial [Gaiellaceae bacterium]|nr:hypothetical protein [Gaiellaceae bacterium]